MLINPFIFGAGAGGGGAVTLDPTRKGANVELSNLNKTANVLFIQSVLATGAAKNSGKWYFEVRVGAQASGYGYVGLAMEGINTGIDFSNQTNVWWRGLGNVGLGTTGSGFGETDVLGIAVDFSTLTVTGYRNNVLQWTSGQMTAGSYLPGLAQAYGNGYPHFFTLLAAAADLTYAPPAGYTLWG